MTAVLYDNGHEIYGQDFSSKMIEIASEKMPKAHLCHGDFSKGLVKELLDQKYDFIVSTYAMHHLSDEEKTGFIPKLLEQLKDDGTLLIGDIAFKDQNAMETCKKAMGDEWDEQECYFVADELRKRYPDLVFLPKSYCSGIFVLKKTKTWKSMNQRRLRECDYSPGYGDMRGEIHSEVLRKNNNGKWQIVRRDRESLNNPTIVTTFAVSEEALARFESMLEEKDILSLADREDSSFFISDYSPWSYRFFFEKEEGERPVLERYQFTQYKEYSDVDQRLLEDLKHSFEDLHGELISKEEEGDGNGRTAFLKGLNNG